MLKTLARCSTVPLKLHVARCTAVTEYAETTGYCSASQRLTRVRSVDDAEMLNQV